MKTISRLSADELVRVYQLRKQGKAFKEIAYGLGKPESLVSALSYAYLRISGKKKSKRQQKTYNEAMKRIRQINKDGLVGGDIKFLDTAISGTTSLVAHFEPIAEKVGDTGTQVTNDPYDKLRRAQAYFEESIQEFIELQVAAEVKEYKAQMDGLIKDNERLNKELSELQVFKEEAKKSNWIDNLRGKFNHSAGV